jgi:hypothetical protein
MKVERARLANHNSGFEIGDQAVFPGISFSERHLRFLVLANGSKFKKKLFEM